MIIGVVNGDKKMCLF